MKKTLILSLSVMLAGLSLAQEVSVSKNTSQAKQNPQIDVHAFFDVSNEAAKHRKEHLVTIEKFNEMSKEKGTIILDSRSESAFKAVTSKVLSTLISQTLPRKSWKR